MILKCKRQHFLLCAFFFVLSDLLYCSRQLQTCISPENRQVSSFPSLVVFLSNVRYLLNVERVGFVFRMRNASTSANPFFTPRKNCLRAGTTSARRWVNMNEFLRSCTYVNKNRSVVDKDPLRCYIKIFPQILKVVITKPYKRLRKKIKPNFNGSFYT